MPYDLPANQTVSAIKSRSTSGGNSENFNEIRFDDKNGQEDLAIHAENAMHNSVEGSQFITVGGNRNITTGGVDKSGKNVGDVKELIFGSQQLTIKRDQIVRIERDAISHVVGNAQHNHDGYCAYYLNEAFAVETGSTIYLNAADSIILTVGGSGIVIDGQGVRIVGSPLLQLNSAPIQTGEVKLMNPYDPKLPDK